MIKSKLKFREYEISKTGLRNVVKAYNTNERRIDNYKSKISFKKLKKYLIEL